MDIPPLSLVAYTVRNVCYPMRTAYALSNRRGTEEAKWLEEPHPRGKLR
jgi:hypothetical protein